MSSPLRTAARPRERLADLRGYRALVESFLHRQLRTRFLGSRIGWLWSLVNPLAMLAAYWLVFGVILGADRGMPPSAHGLHLFAVYLFTGLVAWNTFTSVLTRTIDGLVELMPLRRKVAFPVLAPLLGSAMATVVERSVEVLLLVVVYVAIGNIGPTVLLLPILVVLTGCLGLGFGLLLSVANVKYRDIGHLIGVALQLYFYATPVIYPPAFVDQRFPEGHALRPFLVDNPLAQLVGAYRDVLWDLTVPSPGRWLAVLGWTVGALAVGWWYFRDRAYLIGEES